MRIGGLLAIAVLASGCNLIFGLESGSGGDDDSPLPDGAQPDADPEDLDGDGVANGVDNCPLTYNPRQADEDGDAEVNGGDACDPCPHRSSNPAGSPHLDSDGDGLGDECDPDDSIWHCLRWFDGFSDAPDATILDRYAFSEGVWGMNVGYIVQSDSLAEKSEMVIRELVVDSPFVTTQGRMETIPTTGPAGQMPYRNAFGVMSETAGYACFASLSRGVNGGVPTAASVALSSRSGSEIVSAAAPMGNGAVPLIAGQRFGATLDALSVPDNPQVVGALLDLGVAQSTGAVLACPPGNPGVRTSFSAIRFEYLLVLERGTTGVTCPTRLPASGPIQ